MDGTPVQTRRIPDADESAQRTEFDVTDPQGGQRCVVVLTLSGTVREPSGSKIYGHCRTDCRHQSLMGELAVSNVDHSGGFKFTCNPEVMIQGRNL